MANIRAMILVFVSVISGMLGAGAIGYAFYLLIQPFFDQSTAGVLSDRLLAWSIGLLGVLLLILSLLAFIANVVADAIEMRRYSASKLR